MDCLISCGTTKYWDRLKSLEEAVEKLLKEKGNTCVPMVFNWSWSTSGVVDMPH